MTPIRSKPRGMSRTGHPRHAGKHGVPVTGPLEHGAQVLPAGEAELVPEEPTETQRAESMETDVVPDLLDQRKKAGVAERAPSESTDSTIRGAPTSDDLH